MVTSSTQDRAEEENPSEAMEIVSYCIKSGGMSRKLGIGEIPFHQVMSGDSDDIQNHR